MKKPNNPPVSQALTDELFWRLFYGDLDQVVGHVVIQSAFLWDARMKKIERRIKEAITRGATVCIFIQAPSSWYKENLTDQQQEELQGFYNRCLVLQSWGVHLNLKSKVHQKIAILDGKVHYEGSLNIMSHRDTGENMRRFSIPTEADVIANLHGLDLCLICNQARIKNGTGSLEENALAKVGECIKRQRRDLGLSQGQLSARCGVERTQLSRLERLFTSSLSVFANIIGALDLEILLVPKRHILCVSDFLDRLANNELTERPNRWVTSRVEEIYRLSPFSLHLPPGLAERETQQTKARFRGKTLDPSSQSNEGA